MVEFAEKTRELSLPERAQIAKLVVSMWPTPKSPSTRNIRSLKAAVLVVLAEHPGAPTSQLVVYLDGCTEDSKVYARRVATMTSVLRGLSALGLVTCDKEPRFVPRAHFGPRWKGGSQLGVEVPDHTACWELGNPVTAVLAEAI